MGLGSGSGTKRTDVTLTCVSRFLQLVESFENKKHFLLRFFGGLQASLAASGWLGSGGTRLDSKGRALRQALCWMQAQTSSVH